jgi:hypothetical protein
LSAQLVSPETQHVEGGKDEEAVESFGLADWVRA